MYTSTFGFLVSLFFLCSTFLNAADITGKVVERGTNEPLLGATITVVSKTTGEITKYYDVAGLDGTYKIKNLPQGSYLFRTEFIGYSKSEKEVNITTESKIVLNFIMLAETNTLDEVTVFNIKDNTSDESARADERKADQVL